MPPKAVTGVECAINRHGAGCWLVEFEVADPNAALVLPEPRAPGRADELWRTTCFELFLRQGGDEAYFEFNLSPSRQWAAYAFDSYRQGMADLDVAAPAVGAAMSGEGRHRLQAVVEFPGMPGPWLAGLAAVIEEADGTKSYWALAHGSDKPDFHHPDSFVLELS